MLPISIDIHATPRWGSYQADPSVDLGEHAPLFDSMGVGIANLKPLVLHEVSYSDSLKSNDRERFGYPPLVEPAPGEVVAGAANRIGVSCLALREDTVLLTRTNSRNLLGESVAPTGSGGATLPPDLSENATLMEFLAPSVLAELSEESGVIAHSLTFVGAMLWPQRGWKPEFLFVISDFTTDPAASPDAYTAERFESPLARKWENESPILDTLRTLLRRGGIGAPGEPSWWEGR